MLKRRFSKCPNCMEKIKPQEETCPVCGCFIVSEQDYTGALPIGKLINKRYEIGKVYFKDDLTFVYVAYDRILKTKVFVREYGGEGLFLENEADYEGHAKRTSINRYLNYGKRIASIGFDSIVPKTIDVFEYKQKGYIVTEFFEGQNLKELLNSGVKVSKGNALKIVNSLCEGLKPLHHAHIIFGRICPETVFVEKGSGNIKLFGLGSPFFEIVKDFDLKVKYINPSYAAPEIFEENSLKGAFTDTYSVAAILYRLLTNTIPTISFLRQSGVVLPNPRRINHNIEKSISISILNAMNLTISKRTKTPAKFIKDLPNKKVKRVYSLNAFLNEVVFDLWNLGVKAYHFVLPLLKKAKQLFKKICFFVLNNKRLSAIIALALVLVLVVLPLSAIFIKKGIDASYSSYKDGWFYYGGDGDVDDISRVTFVYEESSSKIKKSIKDKSSKNSTVSSKEAEIVCPNVEGMFLDAAKQLIRDSGLRIGKINYEYSKDILKDTVISQSIKAEKEVTKNQKIDLLVSKGPEGKELPNVTELNITEAIKRLKASGFANLDIQYTSEETNAGLVISQTPAAFEFLKGTEKITLKVGGIMTVVPQFKGKTLADAVALEQYAAFDIRLENVNGASLTNLDFAEYNSYLVIKQSVDFGFKGYKGQKIILVLDENPNN